MEKKRLELETDEWLIGRKGAIVGVRHTGAAC